MKTAKQELKSILLEEYKKASKTGKMPVRGICHLSFLMSEELSELYFTYINLLEPQMSDYRILEVENKSEIFWGSDSPSWKLYKFTPLRQTILAFIIAMCDE